jgi:FkbM family methyltransferase
MQIGGQPAFWRRIAFKALDSLYFCRKVKTSDGVCEMYVSPNSGLKFLRPFRMHIDRVHLRFIHDWVNPDGVVWDVGANLGLFAFPAALKASSGRVYGFEPDVDLAANLLRSLRRSRNQQLNLTLFCLALSNIDSTATFQVSKFSRAMNKLEDVGKWRDAQVVTKELRTVATMRIDTLSQSLVPPTALKIDVEGAEMLVLEGGEETISKYRPAILIEGPHELWGQMRSFFRKHDYLLFDGTAQHPVPLDGPVWDTIAVPIEKSSNYYGRIL